MMRSNAYSCPRCGRERPDDGDPLDSGCRGCGYDLADEEEAEQIEAEREALFRDLEECLKEAKNAATRSDEEDNWINGLVDIALSLWAWSSRCERADLLPRITRMLTGPPEITAKEFREQLRCSFAAMESPCTGIVEHTEVKSDAPVATAG